MEIAEPRSGLLPQILTSIRIVSVTMALCCLAYPLAILCIGQTLVPKSANGSLVQSEQGEIVGSELIAQGFSRAEYFWPRPSAVDYNAAAAGGSNLSPANPRLRARAEETMKRFHVTLETPISADLITASGSGLDPHITLAAAGYQARRVASARNLPVTTVEELLGRFADRPGGALTREPLVNVLLVNMALDRLEKTK